MLIPEKTDIEFEALLRAWIDNGGQVKRLGKFWIRDEALVHRPIAIYGSQAFALVLAQIYGVTLISPDDASIAGLGREWLKRRLALRTIEELSGSDFPAFIKPVIPKLFAAGIFEHEAALHEATKGLETATALLVAEPLSDITAEARSFVRKGIIKDIAFYEGSGDLAAGRLFLETFLDAHHAQLPEVLVIDLAWSQSKGWMILEFNACWGAGLNNCQAEKVLDCILEATSPSTLA